MADILAINPQVVFQRAQVIEGTDTQIGKEDQSVINITLNPKDYQLFNNRDVVEL